MRSGQRRWLRLLSALVALTLVGCLVVFKLLTRKPADPAAVLANTMAMEEVSDPSMLQPLGWNLAILGRDQEVKAMNFFPAAQMPETKVTPDSQRLNVVPWRDAISDIASKQRLVMIMEDHCLAEHRDWIESTLRCFKAAGFSHYAAEALGESGDRLKRRGYPTHQTGFYTADPSFGNLLRTAIEFDFKIHAYDFGIFSHEHRESSAAKRLAKILEQPDARLIVHVGHAHVLKYETSNGMRWLAARLWERANVEPFTIWQWSNTWSAVDYETIALQIGEKTEFAEPVMLLPPPDFEAPIVDGPYQLAPVDGILVHPPTNTTAVEGMHTIRDSWKAPERPVVVCAYRQGEPDSAVPLDQMMLREGEHEYKLVVPQRYAYELRVFGVRGRVH